MVYQASHRRAGLWSLALPVGYVEGAEPGVTRCVVGRRWQLSSVKRSAGIPAHGKVGLLARQALSSKQCCMQLGRVRWANAELLARQAKDAMRRLKLSTLKLRLTRVKNTKETELQSTGLIVDDPSILERNAGWFVITWSVAADMFEVFDVRRIFLRACARCATSLTAWRVIWLQSLQVKL